MCRTNRTLKAPTRNAARSPQGRPLGFLIAWLRAGPRCASFAEHQALARGESRGDPRVSLAARISARQWAEQQQGLAWVLDLERPLRRLSRSPRRGGCCYSESSTGRSVHVGFGHLAELIAPTARYVVPGEVAAMLGRPLCSCQECMLYGVPRAQHGVVGVLAQAMSCQRDEGVAGHFVPSNKTPRKKHVEIMSDVREEVGKRGTHETATRVAQTVE